MSTALAQGRWEEPAGTPVPWALLLGWLPYSSRCLTMRLLHFESRGSEARAVPETRYAVLSSSRRDRYRALASSLRAWIDGSSEYDDRVGALLDKELAAEPARFAEPVE